MAEEFRYVPTSGVSPSGWALYDDKGVRVVATGTVSGGDATYPLALTSTDGRWAGPSRVIVDVNVPGSTNVNARTGGDTYVIRSSLANTITITDIQAVGATVFNIIQFDDGFVSASVALIAGDIVITFGSAKTITVSDPSVTKFQIADGDELTGTKFVADYAAGFTADKNDAPALTLSGSTAATVNENTLTTSSRDAGLVVTATDADSGDTIAYTFDDDRFEISGSSVRIKAGQTFDFEVDNGKTVTITGTDSGVGALTGTATFNLHVRNTPETPTIVRSTVAANANETTILDRTDLLIRDGTKTDGFADFTYKVTNAVATTGALEKLIGENWTAFVTTTGDDDNNSFTQDDVNDGLIRFVANAGTDVTDTSFLFTATDGGVSSTTQLVTLETRVRMPFAVATPANANTVANTAVTASQIIDTGDANDIITTGKGNDQINAGLGDDTINLLAGGAAGGADDVVYDFGAGGKAVDGGDTITSFKRGEDRLIFKEAEVATTTTTTLDAFLASARGTNLNSLDDDLFIVTPNYELDSTVFYITGVTFNFREAAIYSTNKISSGLLSVTFAERVTWASFLTDIGGIGEIDLDIFALKDPRKLSDVLGQDSFAFEETFAAGVVSIAGLTELKIGTGALTDTLDASAATGAQLIQGGALIDTITGSAHGDVIAGGYGKDVITLGAGADTVVWRYSSDAAGLANTGASWVAVGGGDTINNFKYGVDKFVFVDITAGTAATLATWEASPATGSSGNKLGVAPIFNVAETHLTGVQLQFSASFPGSGVIVPGEDGAGGTLTINWVDPILVVNNDFTTTAAGTRLLGADLGDYNFGTLVVEDAGLWKNYFNGADGTFDGLIVTSTADLGFDVL